MAIQDINGFFVSLMDEREQRAIEFCFPPEFRRRGRRQLGWLGADLASAALIDDTEPYPDALAQHG